MRQTLISLYTEHILLCVGSGGGELVDGTKVQPTPPCIARRGN